MKKFGTTFLSLVIIFTALSLASCNSGKKAVYSGNYDHAINKAVSKLKRKHDSEKNILLLEDAYVKAVERDQNQAEYLKKEGRPNKWMDVYNLYIRMEHRQQQIRPILPLYIKSEGRYAQIETINLSNEIAEAKTNAAEYLYADALQLLHSNNKHNARKAYEQLRSLSKFYPGFRDTYEQINIAKSKGTNHVLISVQNNTGMLMPQNLESQLIGFSTQQLNHRWVDYDTQSQYGKTYDYDLLVNLQFLDVSPESVREKHYKEEKEIKDGWEYVLDENGNVKKDTLGNDIKVDKYSIIYCEVIETEQHKTARLSGTVEMRSKQTRELLGSYPITSDASFSNRFAITKGNRKALKSETKKLLRGGPLPFPNDYELISKAGNDLKRIVLDVIDDHAAVVLR